MTESRRAARTSDATPSAAASPDGQRRAKRLPVQMPVVLRGTDAAGRGFFDRAEVVSLDPRGARMRTRFLLNIGSEVNIQLPQDPQARRLRVVWRGDEGSLYEGMVGMEFLDPTESWDLDVLRTHWGSR